jgi:Ca2+-binding RTX toxin-like protein
MATWTGTIEDDVYVGTAADDTLNGLAGNDTISGLAGNDIISGDEGSDSLDGGEGNDSLIGGSGDDYLVGGSGSNSFDGGSGDDYFRSTSLTDTANGGDGIDTFSGNYSNQTAAIAVSQTGSTINISTSNSSTSSISNIEIFEFAGGSGNDNVNFSGATNWRVVLYGNTGNNTLIGGAGDDILEGGTGGKNTLTGGAGNDYFTARSDRDVIDGGTGIDQLTLNYFDAANLAAGVNLTFSSNGATTTNTGSISNIEQLDRFSGTLRDDIVNASAFTPTANGNPFISWYADRGNDQIIGTAIADYISGGAGNDQLNGGSGDDQIDGGYGADTLIGGFGNDVIDGDADYSADPGDIDGNDTAIYVGARNTFTIARIDDYRGTSWQIVDNDITTGGNEGTDTLQNVELVTFNGGSPTTLTLSQLIGELTDTNSVINTVGLNQTSGSVGIQAQAIDGNGQSVSYSLVDNASGKFTINANTGIVSVASGAVFNTIQPYQITVRAAAADGSLTQQIFELNTAIENRGTTALIVDSANTYVADNGSSTIAITYNGAAIGPTSYAGWEVIGAEIVGTDVNAMWKSSGGIYWLSSNTNTGGIISDVVAYETSFQQDFNGDGTIGATTLIEQAGTTRLSINSSNYYVANNGTGDVVITYGGNPVATNSFAGWRIIGAEIVGAEVKAMWQYTSGLYWYSTNTNTGGIVTGSDYEFDFQQDFDGDGLITQLGSNSNNTLNGGTSRDRLVGLGGNDTLNGSAGDDVLLGGSGNNNLAGGIGRDVFFYDATALTSGLAGLATRDEITDFNPSDDRVDLRSLLQALTATSTDVRFNPVNAGRTAIQIDLNRSATGEQWADLAYVGVSSSSLTRGGNVLV